jgi:hypothetical protein
MNGIGWRSVTVPVQLLCVLSTAVAALLVEMAAEYERLNAATRDTRAV